MTELDLGGHARSLGLLPAGTSPLTPFSNGLPQQASSMYPEESLSWISQASPYPNSAANMDGNIDPALSSIDPALENSTVEAPTTAAQHSDENKSRTPSLQIQGNGSTESAETSESRRSSPLTDVDPAFSLTSAAREVVQAKSNGTNKSSALHKTSLGSYETSPRNPLNQMHEQGTHASSVAVEDGEEGESSKLVRELAGEQFGLRRRS